MIYYIKKLLIPFTCLLICLCVFLSKDIHVHAYNGNIDTIQIEESVSPEEERNIYVYTPEGYSNYQEYTTLYILEGLYSTDNEALDLPYQAILSELIADEAFPPIIAVVIPECVYSETGIREIISIVDSRYSTKKVSSGRIISGFSNGAYWIWNNILTNSSLNSLADTYIPMSPIGCRTIISGENAFRVIRYDADRIRIFNTCGDTGCEENYRGIYGGAEQMELIIETGRQYGYIEERNIFQNQVSGEHNWNQGWNAFEEVLPRALDMQPKFFLVE